MSETNIILAPGQGAQKVGMGQAWFDASDAAKKTFAEADAILGDQLGAPLSALCFNGPDERLNQTDVSQPAIYVTSVACYRALAEELGDGPLGATAGLSLGEYTALHIASVFSFEDGLKLVAQRGRFMQEAAEASKSSMVALIGADEEQAHAVCEKAAEGQVLVCANFNAPGQVVISGEVAACERSVAVASEMGLQAKPLTVAGAFHSPLMKSAADRMGEALAGVEFQAPTCPVVSNVTAEPHDGSNVQSIRDRLVDQMTCPVRWAQSCLWLGQTVSGRYHELAPGKVLMGLMRRINREIKVTKHDTP